MVLTSSFQGYIKSLHNTKCLCRLDLSFILNIIRLRFVYICCFPLLPHTVALLRNGSFLCYAGMKILTSGPRKLWRITWKGIIIIDWLFDKLIVTIFLGFQYTKQLSINNVNFYFIYLLWFWKRGWHVKNRPYFGYKKIVLLLVFSTSLCFQLSLGFLHKYFLSKCFFSLF